MTPALSGHSVTPSLRKRLTKLPNIKPLRLFSRLAQVRERISINMHSIESRLVIGPSNILFASLYVCAFQSGNFTGWGSEEVNCERQSHKAVSTKHNLFEVKGEPKRNRAEALNSAYQPNALPLGQTGSLNVF